MRFLPHLLLVLLSAVSPRAGELEWWREFPADRLQKTTRGVEWFPGATNREAHVVFADQVLPKARGSRVSVSGEITFAGSPMGRDAVDSLRIGLFQVDTPTRRDGPRDLSVAEGVEIKMNPTTPPERTGTLIRTRRRTDSANRSYVLNAATWKGGESKYPGFGCVTGMAYPFVFEIEQTAQNGVLARMFLNDRMVEHRLGDQRFNPNTLAVGRTGSGTWASVKVESLAVRVVHGSE